MVEVRRKESESFESLLRRFTRKIQQSGIIIRARKSRFYEPPKSKSILRQEALKRAENREKREELKRMGKIGYQSFSNRSYNKGYTRSYSKPTGRK